MGTAYFGLLLMIKAPEQLEGHSSSGFCLKGHMWVIALLFLSWQENRIAVLFVVGGQKVLPLSCTKSQIFDLIYKKYLKNSILGHHKKIFFFFFSLSSTQLAGERSGRATQPLCRLTNLPHLHPQL